MSQNENSALRITLPFPPSVNHYWRNVAMGKYGTRTLISKRGREYREEALRECCVQHVTNTLINTRLAVNVTLYPPTRSRRDIDNYVKALLDALTHAGVWLDDEQIDDLRIVRGSVVKGGKAVIEIEELDALRMMVA